MSPFIQVGILLSIGIVLGVALGYGLAPSVLVRLAKRETARVTAELASVYAQSTETLQEMTQQLRRTLAERDDFERRAESNRKAIETVLKERDGWQELYDKQSIGHGNAQAIMMDAVGFLEAKLAAAGVTVELPAIVRETQDLYLMAHVLPAVQRSGGTVIHRGETEPHSAPDPEKDTTNA